MVENQRAVDNKTQAWHKLKVLDTIEIFLVSSSMFDAK
jgi:hypothetical protein